MKTKTKFFLLLSTAFAVISFINRCIFKTAKYPVKHFLPQSCFNWRFGRIRYVCLGAGAPILLIHSTDTGQSMLEWENIIQALARSHKVYAIDLLGFGLSCKPKISYSSYIYASLIKDFIKIKIGQKTSVISSGESARFAVCAYKLDMSLFDKMLFVSPPSGADIKNISPLLFKLLKSPVIGTFIYAVRSSKLFLRIAMLKRGYIPSKKTLGSLTANARSGGIGGKYPRAAESSGFLYAKHMPLSDIQVPVLTLNNNPHITNPEAFLNTCRDFFKKTPV